jgi:hypothetical protein
MVSRVQAVSEAIEFSPPFFERAGPPRQSYTGLPSVRMRGSLLLLADKVAPDINQEIADRSAAGGGFGWRGRRVGQSRSVLKGGSAKPGGEAPGFQLSWRGSFGHLGSLVLHVDWFGWVGGFELRNVNLKNPLKFHGHSGTVRDQRLFACELLEGGRKRLGSVRQNSNWALVLAPTPAATLAAVGFAPTG